MKYSGHKDAPTDRKGKAAIGKGFPARTRRAGLNMVKPNGSPSRAAAGAKGGAKTPARSAKYEHNRRKGL